MSVCVCVCVCLIQIKYNANKRKSQQFFIYQNGKWNSNGNKLTDTQINNEFSTQPKIKQRKEKKENRIEAISLAKQLPLGMRYVSFFYQFRLVVNMVRFFFIGNKNLWQCLKRKNENIEFCTPEHMHTVKNVWLKVLHTLRPYAA